MGEDFLRRMRSERERALAEAMRVRPEESVRGEAERLARSARRPFTAALLRPGGPHLIAEFKRASPSAGDIRADADPARIAAGYARGGAAAISVLTEPAHFKGSLDDLRRVREAAALPVLRKDFLFHPYQLYEAAVHGADAVLLIVAMLSPEELGALHAEATRLGLECLVEVHDGAELDAALRLPLRLVGINNRNLKTLRVDLGTTLRLAPRVPAGVAVVSESGIRSRADVERLSAAGVSAILVGESLLRSPDPAAAAAALLGAARAAEAPPSTSDGDRDP